VKPVPWDLNSNGTNGVHLSVKKKTSEEANIVRAMKKKTKCASKFEPSAYNCMLLRRSGAVTLVAFAMRRKGLPSLASG
jgi:hypothetical protein